jgi:outer membrane lipoprotein-sorting protein
MERNDRAALRTTASIGVLLAVLGVAIAAGFVVAQDDPSGSDVLTDVEDRYESADSVVVDASVTTEYNGTVSEFDVSTVTTNSGQMRVNMSNETDYVAFGHTGNTSWFATSTTAAPIVIQNGTVVGQSSLPDETNVSAMFGNRSNGPPARDTSPEHAALTPENVSVSAILEETNATAEFVETTTIDGQTVHVIRTASTEHDGEITLWTTTDTATVVKYRVTTPNGTMTADISETHFDVSPAESTFRPPTDNNWKTTADTLEEMQAITDQPIAIPDEPWSFERGAVLTTPVSAVVSQYTAAGSNVSVIYSESPALSKMPDNERTVDVDNRTVTVSDTDSDNTVARWSEGDRTVVVVSDLSEAELLDVVAGIEFTDSDD